MAQHPRSVDEAIARFDEVVGRWDGRTPEAIGARRRHYGRRAGALARRLATAGVAVGALILATIAFGYIVGPIGMTGLFLVVVAILALLVLFSIWPTEPKRAAYSEQLPTTTVVRQLDSLLVNERPALPAPAARETDAIAAQLPLLESRLADVDPLDPLAQDARRLMGKHLPELIERYEKVPESYRRERDSDGLTVDERLASSLGAARAALSDIGAKLAAGDRDAFEIQGRFIESRYKDPGSSFQGE
ncbi:hypothetical protein [Allosphingosinicella sp.]|uniref:hypothetical protein n=1 Tax=Allosphingosinicella sp. TaxID=2823234 RepID=UPI002EFF92E0